jgi:hypothetical protein
MFGRGGDFFAVNRQVDDECKLKQNSAGTKPHAEQDRSNPLIDFVKQSVENSF